MTYPGGGASGGSLSVLFAEIVSVDGAGCIFVIDGDSGWVGLVVVPQFGWFFVVDAVDAS